MNYQDLREEILRKKPKYNEKFKPLMEQISTKGDSTRQGSFSTLGAFYQTYMYAYIIGLRLGKKISIPQGDEKVEFAEFRSWKPEPVRDFILITLLNRTKEFRYSWDWSELENSSDDDVSNFVVMLIREMEAYANAGLIYLQEKWDNEKILFNSPFVFVNILQNLPGSENS